MVVPLREAWPSVTVKPSVTLRFDILFQSGVDSAYSGFDSAAWVFFCGKLATSVMDKLAACPPHVSCFYIAPMPFARDDFG